MIPYCILTIEDDSDRAFMEALYRNYKRLMFSTIFEITKNNWNTEDIMHLSIIKLISKISLLRGMGEKQLIGYITSTCRNETSNYLSRNHGKKIELPFDEDIDISDPEHDGHEFEVALIKEEELGCLARIWPKLDERTRYLLEGYYILGKSMSELGKELGVKPDSVRMAMTRARKSAYKLLEKELETSR